MVMYAQFQYLQDEQTALVVQSSFDQTLSQFFRSVPRHSSFTPEAVQNLQDVATTAIAAGWQGGSLN